MTLDEAFIQAIRETARDDTPRLIYADWLEEHGQADRAVFIRIQCRLARATSSEPEQSGMMERAEELLRGHWNEWVGPLRDIVGQWRDRYGERWLGEEYHPDGLRRFSRGFVDSLGLDTETFLHHVGSLKRLVPLRELRLWGAGRCAERLAREPQLAGLRVLSFLDYYDAPLTAGAARELARSPYLHSLSTLYLGGNALGDDGVAALVNAPWLAHVLVLDLSDNGLSDRALHALMESPHVVNVKKLYLRNNYFSSDGIDALTAWATLRSLTHLEYDSSTRNNLLLGGSRQP